MVDYSRWDRLELDSDSGGGEGETRRRDDGGKSRGNQTILIRYGNGDVYEGELKEGTMHGRGVCRFADGFVYDGEWKDGKRHGNGMYRSPDGDVYDGEWIDDEAYGKGTYKWKDTNVFDYEGQWKEGKENGKGTLRWKDGRIYEGGFVNGEMHGRGTITHPSGDVYEGQWVEGARHGDGALKYSSGDIYEGVWSNGQREKKGIMKWANGDVQTGRFDCAGGCKLRSHRSQQRRLETARKACEKCGEDDCRYKLRACSGCSLALYCSIACQRAASGSHRRICDITAVLPSRDHERLVLTYDKDKLVDLDAGLRYGTKYMDNVKHLKINLFRMGKIKHPRCWISVDAYDVWRELHNMKQLRLYNLGFNDAQPIGDIIRQQRNTLKVLYLSYLNIDWHRAKTRKTIAQAINACKHLVKLDLRGGVLMDSDLKTMLQDLPDLRILDLAVVAEDCHEFTDNTCGLIARKCPGLQELDLDGHNQLSVRGVRKIFEGCARLRAFHTTTRKLSCGDVRSLLDIAPQLLHLSLGDKTRIPEDDLTQIVEATGGRTVLQVSNDGEFEPDGVSAEAKENYESQSDVLQHIWSRQDDPEVANEWEELVQG